MENIVAHSLEKLYREFEKADQIFLESSMKNMDAYEKGLAEAAGGSQRNTWRPCITAWTGCCAATS